MTQEKKNVKPITVINQSSGEPITVNPITSVQHEDGTVYSIEPTIFSHEARRRAAAQRKIDSN